MSSSIQVIGSNNFDPMTSSNLQEPFILFAKLRKEKPVHWNEQYIHFGCRLLSNSAYQISGAGAASFSRAPVNSILHSFLLLTIRVGSEKLRIAERARCRKASPNVRACWAAMLAGWRGLRAPILNPTAGSSLTSPNVCHSLKNCSGEIIPSPEMQRAGGRPLLRRRNAGSMLTDFTAARKAS